MTPIPCRTCGSTHWRTIAGGNATWEEWIDTSTMSMIEIEDEELNKDHDIGWTCANGHEATNDVLERLEELR